MPETVTVYIGFRRENSVLAQIFLKKPDTFSGIAKITRGEDLVWVLQNPQQFPVDSLPEGASSLLESKIRREHLKWQSAQDQVQIPAEDREPWNSVIDQGLLELHSLHDIVYVCLERSRERALSLIS